MSKRDQVEIYTFRSAPFRLGGTHEAIKAEIDEPIVSIHAETEDGREASFWVLTNPDMNLTLCFSRECGAVIGGGKNEGEAIASVIEDIRTAKGSVIDQQVKQGRMDCASATAISEEQFWHHHRHLAK